MTPDMIASEIKKRWEGVATELVHRKRLDPNVYEEVVSALARTELLNDLKAAEDLDLDQVQ